MLGEASIMQYKVMQDKRFILTEDTSNKVAVYDVLTARKVEDLGHVNFEEEVIKREKITYVPNWFSVDINLGMVSIRLEDPECFQAWNTAKDVEGFEEYEPITKLNYGGLLLHALLEHWPATQQEGKKPEGNNGTSDEQEQRKSLSESDTSTASNNVATTTTNNESTTKQGNKLLFKVPPHTPIVFSESNGRTIFRLLCQDASGKAESNHLRDTAPPWVIQTVTENKISSQFLKLSFFLQPHPSSGLKPVKSTNSKLLATDMLTIGKVCDHVRDKILSTTTNGDDASQSSSSQTVESATQDKSEA